MITRARGADLRIGSGKTVRFDGEDHGSQVSFFLVDNQPGQGPDLHRHGYTETWVVLEGDVSVFSEGTEYEATAGDILVVSADTPHRFRANGEQTLRMMCIHASPRIQQEFLAEDPARPGAIDTAAADHA